MYIIFVNFYNPASLLYFFGYLGRVVIVNVHYKYTHRDVVSVYFYLFEHTPKNGRIRIEYELVFFSSAV